MANSLIPPPPVSTGHPNYAFSLPENAAQVFSQMLPPRLVTISDFAASDLVERVYDTETQTCRGTFLNQNNQTLVVEGWPLPADTKTNINYFNPQDFLFVPRNGGTTRFEYKAPVGYMKFTGLYGHLSRIDIYWEATTSNYDVSMATKMSASNGTESQSVARVRDTQNHNHYVYDLNITGTLLLTFEKYNKVYNGMYYRGTYMTLTLSEL